jgi:hypothetical protein
VIENVHASTLEAFVNEAVSNKVRLPCTDQWVGYKHLGLKFPHATVDHTKEQYVVGVHTQTIECLWSIFKRVIADSFHKGSRKYVPLSDLRGAN